MRIKYKAPTQFFYRKFWLVTAWSRNADGSIQATNKAGHTLYLPPGMVVITVGKLAG